MKRRQFCHLENSGEGHGYTCDWASGRKPTNGRRSYARRKISYLLWSLDCRQILLPVRPLHRYRRTRQVHLQVQQQSEVTIWHQETGAVHQKKKKDINRASDDGLRHLPDWFEEVHRKFRRCRSASTRKHFPGLRFGTSYKSGTQEAKCLYSLPKRQKLQSMLVK